MLAPYSGKNWNGGISGRYQDALCVGLREKVILDPSAGKGDILNFIAAQLQDYTRRELYESYAIEIDTNLQAILKQNDHSVIGADFLQYEQDMYFDVIVMNPPFKEGAKHLLKAIEIAHDTDIICLLNAQTLLNPHTKERKALLAKIEQFGSYEIIGNVFDNAERKTDVNVALVRLHVKDENRNFDFDFSDYQPEKISFDESFIKDELARQDLIGNMMLQFEQAKQAYKSYIEAQKKWEHYTSFLLAHESYRSPKDYDKKDLAPLRRYNAFNKGIKGMMWRRVISELGLERYMTNNVRTNFEQFIQEQSDMTFSKENVRDLFLMLVNNKDTILKQAITDVFDMLTENYYSENRLYVTGWKTNDRYKINRKIIAPVYVKHGDYMSSYDLKQYGDKFSLGYHGQTKYSDIDRCLCYISGKSYESILTIAQALENHFNELGKVYVGEKFNNSCSSTFFDIKFYKKGTVHLTFKDRFLWHEFNMRACHDKNWLPDNERSQWEAKKEAAKRGRQNTRNGVIRIGEEDESQEPYIAKATKKRSPTNLEEHFKKLDRIYKRSFKSKLL